MVGLAWWIVVAVALIGFGCTLHAMCERQNDREENQSSDFQRCRVPTHEVDAEFLNLIFESNHTTVVVTITIRLGFSS
jgi:hypothetical protein